MSKYYRKSYYQNAAVAESYDRERFAHRRGIERDNALRLALGETIRSYGEKVLAAGAGLASRTPREVVTSDMKIYHSGRYQFAIAQVEVNNFYDLSEELQVLSKSLDELRDRNGLDFAMLMVTDVVGGSSRLLISNEPAEFSDLPYPSQADGTRLAVGVVSRKKQLLPIVLGLLER